MNRIDLVAEILLSALSRTSKDDESERPADPEQVNGSESDDSECLMKRAS
jgi:hypothetical protein